MENFVKPLTFTIISFFVAYWFQWTTRDLIWSFWITSLTVGFATILGGLLGPVFLFFFSNRENVEASNKNKLAQQMSKIKEASLPVTILILFIMIFYFAFTLLFFTIHFGGFHLGHAIFLQFFFPHPLVPSISQPENIKPWPIVWGLVLAYWPVIVEKVAFEIFEYKDILTTRSFDSIELGTNDTMIKPYSNVVRIHILIFVLAGLSFTNANQLLIYAVTYAMFYFPMPKFSKKEK
jgi:hypothetical protein